MQDSKQPVFNFFPLLPHYGGLQCSSQTLSSCDLAHYARCNSNQIGFYEYHVWMIINKEDFYPEHENFQLPSDKNSVILYAVICFGGNREWLEQF